MTTTTMVGLYYVNTLDWTIYDYYHYGSPLTSIHSAEVFMITTTMEGFNVNILAEVFITATTNWR
jgi:hypothetical protein